MKNLNLKYRPVIYYTNGYIIKIQDRLGYPAREVGNFASLDDLELLIKRQLPGVEDKRKPIKNKEVDTSIIDRSKLVEAVKEMIDSMNTDGAMRRKGLLVLPCGVGKTRTAVALSKILINNDWAQNVLFLADRNNLVSNALKPFSKQGFFVFDYCNNFEYFDLHPDGKDPSTPLNLNQKIYALRLDILAKLQSIEYQEQPKYKAYHQQLKNNLVEKIKKLDTNRIDVKPKLFYVDKYSKLSAFDYLSDKNVYEIKTQLPS